MSVKDIAAVGKAFQDVGGDASKLSGVMSGLTLQQQNYMRQIGVAPTQLAQNAAGFKALTFLFL